MSEESTFEQKVREALDDIMYDFQKKDGYYVEEIYADYRDELSDKDIEKIVSADYPMEVFWDLMSECYGDAEGEIRQEVEEKVTAYLVEKYYPDGLDAGLESKLSDLVMELVEIRYPEEHFLKQEVYVNIMTDTGDGNYDYTLNSVYPCWYGRMGTAIDPKASIAWLAKTQGYTKGQLRKALDNGDMAKPDGFLESMRVELANLPSHMSTVTFLAKMTLEDLIELNEMIRTREPKQGRIYDNRKYPYCGYIVIDKKAETGLYDPWAGGGSVFEIQLEKDVKLPIKYIRSALPDGADGYSVGSVYGMCGSAWREVVKQIHHPKRERTAS